MANNYRLDVTLKLVLADGSFLSEELFKKRFTVGFTEIMAKGIVEDYGLRIKTVEVKNSLSYDELTGQASWQVDVIPESIKQNRKFMKNQIYHAVFDFWYRIPGEGRFYVCNYAPIKITYADSDLEPRLDVESEELSIDRKSRVELMNESSGGWTPLSKINTDPYLDVSETMLMVEPQTLRII